MKSEERQSDKSGERLGTIYADAVYAYENFQHLIGQGRAGMRSLRMKGLRVIRAGNRRYVIGGDWLMFLQQIASDSNDHNNSLIHNPQSGQESTDLEGVRTSSGSDVFKSGSSYAVAAGMNTKEGLPYPEEIFRRLADMFKSTLYDEGDWVYLKRLLIEARQEYVRSRHKTIEDEEAEMDS